MYNEVLHKSVPDNAITLSKITDTSTSYKNEFNYILMLREQISLPNKMDSYLVKYDLDGNDNLVLNPYLSLINGTDLLITKDIPSVLMANYTVTFDWSEPDKTKLAIALETSSDGITYEKCKSLSGNKWVTNREYKDILLWVLQINITEFPAGTYIRLKFTNMSDYGIKTVPIKHINSECKYSTELRLKLSI